MFSLADITATDTHRIDTHISLIPRLDWYTWYCHYAISLLHRFSATSRHGLMNTGHNIFTILLTPLAIDISHSYCHFHYWLLRHYYMIASLVITDISFIRFSHWHWCWISTDFRRRQLFIIAIDITATILYHWFSSWLAIAVPATIAIDTQYISLFRRHFAAPATPAAYDDDELNAAAARLLLAVRCHAIDEILSSPAGQPVELRCSPLDASEGHCRLSLPLRLPLASYDIDTADDADTLSCYTLATLMPVFIIYATILAFAIGLQPAITHTATHNNSHIQ